MKDLDLNSFEKRRAEKIAENEMKLRELHLGAGDKLPLKKKRTREKEKEERNIVLPIRRSKRQKLTLQDSLELQKSSASTSSCKWADDLFAKQERPTPDWVFDKRKCHPHIQISNCGAIVATTGPAGYGAVLGSVKNKKERAWRIQVLQVGVGGFAVGVCDGSFRAPFKSMGKKENAWMYYSRGVLMNSGNEKVVSLISHIIKYLQSH